MTLKELHNQKNLKVGQVFEEYSREFCYRITKILPQHIEINIEVDSDPSEINVKWLFGIDECPYDTLITEQELEKLKAESL